MQVDGNGDIKEKCLFRYINALVTGRVFIASACQWHTNIKMCIIIIIIKQLNWIIIFIIIIHYQFITIIYQFTTIIIIIIITINYIL
jgi:hypothetical protein